MPVRHCQAALGPFSGRAVWEVARLTPSAWSLVSCLVMLSLFSCDYDVVHYKYLRVRKMLMSFPPTSGTVNFRQVSFSYSCLVLGILL